MNAWRYQPLNFLILQHSKRLLAFQESTQFSSYFVKKLLNTLHIKYKMQESISSSTVLLLRIKQAASHAHA